MPASIEGLAELEADLAGIEKAAGDFRPVWPRVGTWFANRQHVIFATNARGRWPGLAAGTLVRKSKEGLPLRPLIATGALMASVSSAAPRNAGPRFAVFGGIGVPWYARFHVKGSGVPVRDPVPSLTAAEKAEVFDVLREHMRKGMR